MGNVAQQVKQGRAHTQKVAKEVTGKFPQIKWMWTLGATGEHKEGRALDFMTLTDNQQAYQAGLGDKIKDYLLANRERLGIWYIIWNRRIYSRTYGWKNNPYSGSNPHTDHVHVSFMDKPVAYKAPTSTPTTPKETSMAEPIIKMPADKQKQYGYAHPQYYQSALVGDASWRIRDVQQTLRRIEGKLDRVTKLLEEK